MLKKINSANLFSMENHDEQTTEELPEQGVVVEADAEAVVAEATPSEDVTEAGDDIGQATPNDEIDASPDADLTVTETTVQSPDGGETEEVSKLLEEGQQAAATKDEIVATATAEVTGGESDAVDVNGNAITEEQAVENEEQENVDDEVDEEAEKTAADKDIHEQVDDVTENVDEELGDAIGDDSTDGGLDGEATDDTSTDIDSSGSQGDLGMDAETGDLGEPEGGDDTAFDDDTPLEGADDVGTDTDATADDSSGDVGSDETATGSDMDDVESTDGGDLGGEETVDDTVGVDGDSEVADDVATQNEAADVTAEAASSDTEQTDFIAGDTPEQHGEEPSTDELPANDGEEIVAEATPAVQNETDVGSADANMDVTQSTADEVDFDDETPLEGADEETETEDLEVNAEQDLTPTEVDGQEIDGSTPDGATVEESQTDQQAEELDEVNAEPETEEEEGANEPEDGESEVETETETDTDGSTEEVVEDITASGEPGLDAEAGEIEETDEPADLEEGELDIPDVDTETTEEEVEDAAITADEVEAEADADDDKGDIGEKTIEELQRETESLEEFRVMLEWGIANESYDPSLLAYKSVQASRVRDLLNGLGCKLPAVSLESYTAKDMDLAYQASLESVRGMLSRISGISHQLTQKVERWYAKGMVDKVKTRTTALNKQIDLCLVQLKEADVSTHEVNAIGAYLAHADGNLVKAVSDDLKIISDVSVKGFKATEELQTNLVKALNDITGAATPAEATSVADKVSRFKDTKSAFPNKAFSSGFLGGFKFELKEATGGDTLKDKILNMGRRAVPVIVREGKGTNTSQKLSKGDVANLLTMAKAYTALANKLADTTGDRAVDNISKIRLTRERALPIAVEGRVRGGDEAAIDAAASALEIVAKAHNDMYKFVTKHCIDVADALCGVAKKFSK
ncbi:virion structural protein [Pseudomonas phage 201phi2-1]|uniref:Virion structural protein n=1 Tax=Pseudomonas phage 201phi2-1 TaxID=198110 RepID=B3FJ22_BP201|nr:virion structural protein [Pseudomonas phage 201phi2-1]ABY62989.1 virion structural protein [Pseudomonas phage 201phi2-1]